MSLRVADTNETGELRARVIRLRQELADIINAYRAAVAQHDSQNAIPLLRSRSRLMRQLLDAQCELLLSLKSEAAKPQPDSGASAAPLARESVLV